MSRLLTGDVGTGLSGLYGITDPHLLADGNSLSKAVEEALRGGLRVLQYRAKNLAESEQFKQASELRQLCYQYDALFIINDNVELAKAVAADGVHLGSEDSDIKSARKRLGVEAIIGCSCYNRLDLAIKAQQQGADYVAFGRFFPSQTKPEAIQANTELLKQAKLELDIPVCAIGGITTQNATELIDQGTDMIAVIHDLFSARDVYQQASAFSLLFSSTD